MKIIPFFIILLVLQTSCSKKDNPLPAQPGEARYTATITSAWAAPQLTVPPGAHFTTFIGLVHNSDARLWKEGTLATTGMEVLAETGGGAPILAEIDSMIRARSGLALLLFVAPPVNGNASVHFYCNSQYPQISFASMLGPTPDWFTGISSLCLYRDGRWVSDTTISLYTLDAGTEEGDVFGYANPPTVPQQPIRVLPAAEATVLANGNPVLAPVATLRLVRE